MPQPERRCRRVQPSQHRDEFVLPAVLRQQVIDIHAGIGSAFGVGEARVFGPLGDQNGGLLEDDFLSGPVQPPPGQCAPGDIPGGLPAPGRYGSRWASRRGSCSGGSDPSRYSKYHGLSRSSRNGPQAGDFNRGTIRSRSVFEALRRISPASFCDRTKMPSPTFAPGGRWGRWAGRYAVRAALNAGVKVETRFCQGAAVTLHAVQPVPFAVVFHQSPGRIVSGTFGKRLVSFLQPDDGNPHRRKRRIRRRAFPGRTVARLAGRWRCVKRPRRRRWASRPG